MKNLTIALVAIFASISTWAISPTFSGEEGMGGHRGEKMHKCMHDGMTAAELSEDQHNQIHQIMMAAKQVKKDHQAAIHEGMQAMMAAWGKYPIEKAEVVGAEENLKAHMTPVREAMRDGMIDSLNLLSAEQRQKFDDAFMTCIHE